MRSMIIVFSLICAVSMSGIVEAQYVVTSSTFSTGYSELSNSTFSMKGLIGQSLVGKVNDTHVVQSGYIYISEIDGGSATEISPPGNVQISDLPNDHGHCISLTWELSSDDAAISHYYIYRSRASEPTEPVSLDSFDSFELLIEAEQSQTILVGTVSAGVNSFDDLCVPLNNVTYYYWVASVSNDGAVSKLSPIGDIIISVEGNSLPDKFRLLGNFPNPFNPSTTICFELPEKNQVVLNIYSSSGQLIETLLNDTLTAGTHEVIWEPDNISAGVYLYVIETEGKRQSDKMVLVK